MPAQTEDAQPKSRLRSGRLPNGNGIVASRDGRTFIIVHTFLGVLYRVDVKTGFATEIDLDGASVFAGDGLLLRGDRLYVVQNTLNQISVIDLDHHCARGELERVIARPSVIAHEDLMTKVRSLGDRGRPELRYRSRRGDADVNPWSYS